MCEVMQAAHLAGGILMQALVVGDELEGGVPDVARGKLACTLYEGQHHVHIPLQIGIEPAPQAQPISADACTQNHIDCSPNETS